MPLARLPTFPHFIREMSASTGKAGAPALCAAGFDIPRGGFTRLGEKKVQKVHSTSQLSDAFATVRF
jgi:hypothetical protein